ncbi:MAG: beta-lactamase family protein [Gammaproteobacteria bacterium]|jgi:CubicO group peptidase (beta-lactamase class C family)|nr:beta-lactamase family protein [Gammaproteobacteria bacterium]MBT3858573.1 beta-lactamase family protein [Gammaproteobacteria bacterium]MBT3986689.1 beta-lactamase family protein [Gammaproteobacteria bacterium]MBT4257023.1 beta-lactamase family protein [Gammaproteobacteria bacterium]MBT4582785.1 beta-lactamase family protein [Gammaproteobacteria bacterium]
MNKKSPRSLVLPCLSLVLLATISPLSSGQRLEPADPASVGMSSEILGQATANLQAHIDEGDISGVVAAVARDGKLVYFESLGQLDMEAGTPMREDALFRIYSMTREITSAAVLTLYEQGKFNFDDPIKMYLPEFENQRVLQDSSSTDISDVKNRSGDITVAHLLTHTSGLGSRSSALYRENNVRDKNITLDQMVSNAARIPLFQDPGTQFRYGIHATILGKLIEVWSGQDFREYLEENVLEPLDMDSTMFWAQGDDVDRLAQLYRPRDGQLVPHQIEEVPFTSEPKLIEGGVGLLSTVMDFMNFSQMILNGGTFNGLTILQPETVSLMYQNAVPAQAMPIGDRGYWLGSGWTLGGFNLVMDASAYSFPVSEGTIWWDGSAATRFFVDPKQDTVIVIMGQVSPSSGGGFREDFSRFVDQAIIERR